MARKKINIVPIDGLGSDTDKLTVQKSRPLFALWQSDLTLAEFKILDTYLSRINSHEPDKRAVIFEKGELEEKLGVTKINKPELEKRLIHLMGNVVKIPDSDSKRGFRLVTLFEEADAEQDDYGLWQVHLECTQKAMKYFFNVENLGYLQYRLKLITSISSRYSYIMFCYLEQNRFRKSWEVSLMELKQILNCDSEETYKEYKRFNDLILKKVQKELHEKTDTQFIYEPIKRGRSVVALKFTLQTMTDIESYDPNQLTLEQWQEVQEENPYFWAEPLNGEFDELQLKTILEYLICVPESKMSIPSGLAVGENIEFKRYHYISQKLAVMNNADSKSKIKNRFNYFIKLIKNDANIED